MIRIAIITCILALVILTGLAALPVGAQAPNCASYGAVVDMLANKHGETRQAMGIAANDAGMMLFANTMTGTWTILVIIGGDACLVAAGGAYEGSMSPPGMDR